VLSGGVCYKNAVKTHVHLRNRIPISSDKIYECLTAVVSAGLIKHKLHIKIKDLFKPLTLILVLSLD